MPENKDIIRVGSSLARPHRDRNQKVLPGSPVMNVGQMELRDQHLVEAAGKNLSPFIVFLDEINRHAPFPDPDRAYHTSAELAAHANARLDVSWVTPRIVEGVIGHGAKQDIPFPSFDNAVIAHKLLKEIEQGSYTPAIARLCSNREDFLAQMGESNAYGQSLRIIFRAIVTDPKNPTLRDIFIEETRDFLNEKRETAFWPVSKRIPKYLAMLARKSETGIVPYPDSIRVSPWATEIASRTADAIVADNALTPDVLVRATRLDKFILERVKNLQRFPEISEEVNAFLREGYGRDTSTFKTNGGDAAFFGLRAHDDLALWVHIMTHVPQKLHKAKEQ